MSADRVTLRFRLKPQVDLRREVGQVFPGIYNLIMARGWESKSVEQQQEEAASGRVSGRQHLTPEQAAHERRRRGLELSRQRIVQQLQRASNPQHRKMLEAALVDLEAQLKRGE